MYSSNLTYYCNLLHNTFRELQPTTQIVQSFAHLSKRHFLENYGYFLHSFLQQYDYFPHQTLLEFSISYFFLYAIFVLSIFQTKPHVGAVCVPLFVFKKSDLIDAPGSVYLHEIRAKAT